MQDEQAKGNASGEGLLNGLFNGSKPLTIPAADAPKAEKEEYRAHKTADEWRDIAAWVFILAMSILLGDDLKPNAEQAEAITLPILRIVMRHTDPAVTANNDIQDAARCVLAIILYAQAIAPAWKAKQQEKKVTHAPQQPQIVRIDRSRQPAASASGQQQQRSAGMAAAAPASRDSGYATNAPASHDARLSADEQRGYLETHSPASAEAALFEVTGLEL